jgi:hypothetical protein
VVHSNIASSASPTAATALALLSCLTVLILGAPLEAQPPRPDPGVESIVGPFFGRATQHDVSPPLSVIGRHRGPAPDGSETEMPILRRQRTYPPNVSHGVDPLRQIEQRPHPEAALTPAPTSNFDGLANIDGVLPPDTNGDVGVDYYVQWINLSFAVFNKTTGAIAPGGGPFSGESLWTGFGGACASAADSSACACQLNNDGDPIVLYDHLAGRWLMSQFSINEGVQCVALSTTGDPTGSYDRWAFEVSPGQGNDYPKIGLMPEAYYLTTRDFPPDSGNFAGFTALDRTAMLAGTADPPFIKYGLACITDNCVDGVQPPHLEGQAPDSGTHGFFTKTWDDDFEGDGTGIDGYRMWEMVPDFATPGDSTFAELPIVPAGADFDTNLCGGSRSCIEQPPVDIGRCLTLGLSCPTLDGFAELQMYRAQFRHWDSFNSIVISNGVDADGNDTSGVRWAELRDTGAGGTWVVHQDGTYAPADGHSRWMSSIAMDASGNIALGYSVSSTTVFPSIRYTTREAGDPLGVLPGGEVELIAGGGAQTSSSSRWGDYSSMSVDPTDDCTFWYTQEYIQTTASSSWRTRIGSFKIPSCTSACPYSATESLTGTGSGTVAVNACQTVTIGPYNFTGGTLKVTAGASIEMLDGTSLASTVEVAIDPALNQP